MARLMNALQLALGSVGSGIQGYGQAKSLREEQERKAQERLDVLAQQTEQNALAKGNALIARVQSGVRPYQPDEQLGEDERVADVAGLGKMVFGPSQAEQTAKQRAITAAKDTQQKQEYSDRGVWETLTRTINPETRKPFMDPAVPFEQTRGRLQSTFEMAKQTLGNVAAMQRTGAMVAGQASMGSYMPGLTPEGPPTLYFGTRGGQITPTGVGATTSQAGGKIPPVERKNMVELKASIKGLDKALAAVKANPDAFGIHTLLPNTALTRFKGVKERAIVNGAEQELRKTIYGTAMSRIEKESGQQSFTAGGDAAGTVIDKLTAMRNNAQLELDTKEDYYGVQPAAAPPPPRSSAPSKTFISPDEWLDANPPRKNESDLAYKARYKAATGGR